MTHERRQSTVELPGRRVHVLLQVRPDRPLSSVSVTVAGQVIRSLMIESQEPSACLPVSFEQALEQLQQLPRMFVEPDGSWVWVSPAGPEGWQFDGQLHDGPVGLVSVEVKGQAPLVQWEALLPCFGWPETPILFQLVQEGLYLDEDAFRRHVQARDDAR